MHEIYCVSAIVSLSWITKIERNANKTKCYIETYGCQMNMADTEIVLSIMHEAGFIRTETLSSADVVLVNTCAVRDNAEQRIIGRLGDFNHYKKRIQMLL